MSKKLEITEEAAIKLYGSTSCSTVKHTLETLFGTEIFKPKNPADNLTDMAAVIKHLGHNPNKDIISIDGFDEGQTKVLKALVAKMRVCEAFNGTKKLTRNDRRYYLYYRLASGSGLAFHDSSYLDDDADLSSAARLSLKDEVSNKAFLKNFKYIDEEIIGL